MPRTEQLLAHTATRQELYARMPQYWPKRRGQMQVPTSCSIGSHCVAKLLWHQPRTAHAAARNSWLSEEWSDVQRIQLLMSDCMGTAWVQLKSQKAFGDLTSPGGSFVQHLIKAIAPLTSPRLVLARSTRSTLPLQLRSTSAVSKVHFCSSRSNIATL